MNPITFCLSAQGLGMTDPMIMPPLTVQSFPLLRRDRIEIAHPPKFSNSWAIALN